eukprot:444751_1
MRNDDSSTDSTHSVGSTGSSFLNKSMWLINATQKMFFKSKKNPVSGSIVAEGGDSQFLIVGYRLSFDDDRAPEVLEGTDMYIEHQTQCLHAILPGTQQETIFFEVQGCPVVGLTCYKATWKGPFGPFKDVVKLGDFDVGKHEFVYEPKHVPSNMKSRGYFKMHVSFADGAGRQLWEHKRRFRILKKSEGVVLQRCEHLLECNGKKSLSSSTSSVQLP